MIKMGSGEDNIGDDKCNWERCQVADSTAFPCAGREILQVDCITSNSKAIRQVSFIRIAWMLVRSSI